MARPTPSQVPLATVLGGIEKGTLPPILVTRFDPAAGEDLVGRDRLVLELRRAVLGDGPAVFGETVFDGPSVELVEVLDAAREISLLAPRRLVLVRGSRLSPLTQEAIAAETVRIVSAYKDTGKVPNVVNLAKKTPATHMLVVRHRDRPGVLAHVFDHLRSGDINVQETENVIFEGAQAAVARINLDGAPSDALMKTIQEGNGDILDLHLVAI